MGGKEVRIDMAKPSKAEWMDAQKEKIGYDDLSDDEKQYADDCMNQAWKEVVGDDDEDDQPDGRGDREIEHTKEPDDEIDR